MSTIPAPVEAMISGPGSFFGSCQVAANNFAVAFQSAMVVNGTGATQGTATDAQPRGFSTFLEEYGENEVLGNLQEILGEEDGAEAFELALLMAQNDEAFKQLGPKDQMEVFRLFKIMDMAKTSTNDVKALLEDWVKDVKNIFAELKIEFKQPEKQISELEKDTPIIAVMPPEDLKNIKLLAKEMGIKPKDMPKFAALINNLLKNGLITSKDLKDAAKVVSQEFIPAREFIEGLWEFAKNEIKDEIENELVADLPKEPIVDAPKEPVYNPAKEPIVDTSKEPVYNSAKEPVVDTSKEPVPSLAKEPVLSSVKKIISNSAKEPVFSSAKEPVSDTTKEPISDATKEPVLTSGKKLVFNSAKELIADSAKENASGPAKESVPNLVRENFFGVVKENVSGLAENLQIEEDELVETFHALLRKFLRGELTEEEKEKLKHILKTAEHVSYKKQDAPEGEELALEEEEPDSQTDDGIEIKDPAKKNLAFEDLAFEEEVDIKLANTLFNPQKAEKSKRKGFNPEIQQASQTQPSQQTLQTQPHQMRQAQQAQQTQQVQPEVRAVWEGEGLKIELVNPKTGEKLQTTYEAMPQRMQERINEFEVVRQVIAQAKFITTPTGEQKMTMQLHPEHLGQVDLRITLNHSEMQIHARVESVTAQSALETHIGLLREGLEKHGITLDRLEVSVEQRDRQDAYSLAERQEQREQRQNNRRHHRGREQHLAVSVGKNESSDTGRRLGYNTMEYLA